MERRLVARVVEQRTELADYRGAVPGAEPIVCRLTAPIDVMRERLSARELGRFRDQALVRSVELDRILERSAAEDFTVDNGRDQSPVEVAHEVLSRAGWL